MNCFLGHTHDRDITQKIDTIRYNTFFSCQNNGCSNIVGIRNMWLEKSKYQVPANAHFSFAQRLNELDELLYTVSDRQEWSSSHSWNCGNCISYRYQYSVKNRHGYLMPNRVHLDECLFEYSKNVLARYSNDLTTNLTYKQQLLEYNHMLSAIEHSIFDERKLSNFQTCLLFQTLALTGILPLCCYEFSIVDDGKGPYDLIRSVYNSKILHTLKKQKLNKIRRNTTKNFTDCISISNDHTMISQINLRFLEIHKTLSGKENMSISGITHEFAENVLCKISSYLKPHLSKKREMKGNKEDALESQRHIIIDLLSESKHKTLHAIIKKMCDVDTCGKYDSHFFDNGMGKLCNLFRVRPTNKQTGPVLEVRSSTSCATCPFTVQYDDNSTINNTCLQTVFELMYDKP